MKQTNKNNNPNFRHKNYHCNTWKWATRSWTGLSSQHHKFRVSLRWVTVTKKDGARNCWPKGWFNDVKRQPSLYSLFTSVWYPHFNEEKRRFYLFHCCLLFRVLLTPRDNGIAATCIAKSWLWEGYHWRPDKLSNSPEGQMVRLRWIAKSWCHEPASFEWASSFYFYCVILSSIPVIWLFPSTSTKYTNIFKFWNIFLRKTSLDHVSLAFVKGSLQVHMMAP